MDVDKERARRRVASIAEQLVAGQVQAGKLDPKDDEAMEKACRQAVKDAAAAYYAAEEFVGG